MAWRSTSRAICQECLHFSSSNRPLLARTAATSSRTLLFSRPGDIRAGNGISDGVARKWNSNAAALPNHPNEISSWAGPDSSHLEGEAQLGDGRLPNEEDFGEGTSGASSEKGKGKRKQDEDSGPQLSDLEALRPRINPPDPLARHPPSVIHHYETKFQAALTSLGAAFSRTQMISLCVQLGLHKEAGIKGMKSKDRPLKAKKSGLMTLSKSEIARIIMVHHFRLCEPKTLLKAKTASQEGQVENQGEGSNCYYILHVYGWTCLISCLPLSPRLN